MGLDRIRQSVLADAKNEAARILESAKRGRVELLRSRKEAAEEESGRLCGLRMQAIEEECNRKLIQLKGAASKQILDKRNALLRSLFDRAKEEILAWPPEKYGRVMRQLIEKTAASAEGKIRVHPEEADLFQKVLFEVNQDRAGEKIVFDPTAPLTAKGGFIFVSADFEVDQTLDTRLKEVEHELLPSIAADLFPG
jgi:V/A-type H+/Na+-transporting ATPase subunit E